jgi:NACalpha-BTF3-like transcription factor
MENSVEKEKTNEIVNEIVNETDKVKNNDVAESNVILSEFDIAKKRQQEFIKDYYINLQKQKYERFIEITMNQTTYTREEAIASLEKHKGDITLVIKEFLGVVDKSEERKNEQNSKSLHQKRYGVIREYMDNASINYAKKQEEAKRYNDFLEKQQKAKEAQAQAQAQSQPASNNEQQ